MRLSILGLAALVACGGADAPAPVGPSPMTDADAEAELPETGGADDAGPAIEIERDALVEVLDAGPGAFLQGVSMKPHFDEQRFAGWRIEAFYPDDPRYARAGILPGDVIQQVNGKAIMKPDQLFEVWTELRSAEALVVTGLRDGEPLTLEFAIVGPPAAAPAKPTKR